MTKVKKPSTKTQALNMLADIALEELMKLHGIKNEKRRKIHTNTK